LHDNCLNDSDLYDTTSAIPVLDKLRVSVPRRDALLPGSGGCIFLSHTSIGLLFLSEAVIPRIRPSIFFYAVISNGVMGPLYPSSRALV